MDGACWSVFVARIHQPRHGCQDLLSPCGGYMCTQTRPRFTPSSEEVWWVESEPMLTPRKNLYRTKSFSVEDRTHDAASGRTESPTHYQLSYSGPQVGVRDHRFKQPGHVLRSWSGALWWGDSRGALPSRQNASNAREWRNNASEMTLPILLPARNASEREGEGKRSVPSIQNKMTDVFFSSFVQLVHDHLFSCKLFLFFFCW